MALRDDSGQASIEQLGLVLLIALVLVAAGGITAVAAPGLSNRVTTAMQRALCTVSGQACPTLERQPCPLLRTDRTTTTRVSLGVVRLGDDRALLIERRSDGSYVITQVEGIGGGGGLTYGRTGADASVDALLSARAGRIYTAPNQRAAAALVARLHRRVLPAADVVISGVGDLAGLERADPGVESYTVSGQGAVSAAAKLGFGHLVEVRGEGDANVEVGVKIAAHRREATAYVSLDGRVGAFFDMLPEIGLRAAAGGRAGIGARRRPGGRAPGDREEAIEASVTDPLGLSQSGEVMSGGTVALRLVPGPRVVEVEITGRVGTGSSMRELHARIDPQQPEVAAALATWQRHPLDPRALAGLGEAAAASAAVDERRFTVTTRDQEHGAEIGMGISVGGSLRQRLRTTHLVSQQSRPVGGVWEERIDCEAA